ncbi:MAG: arginine decarboxylase, partial [Polyangiales bacterium]
MIYTTGPRPAGTDVESAPEAGATLHNAKRLRTDTWSLIRDAARRLAHTSVEDDEKVRLTDTCRNAFDFLAPIEQYFAFPGATVLSRLRDTFERENFSRFAEQAKRVVGFWTTDSYRQLDLTSANVEDYAELLLRSHETDIAPVVVQGSKPYFEVLIVADVDLEREMELKRELRACRRPSDEQVYEVVIVRTFEDALLACAVNSELQAVFLRHSFPARSTWQPPFLGGMYRMVDFTAAEAEAQMPGQRTLTLARLIQELRSELDLYLVTSAPVEHLDPHATRHFRRTFYRGEDWLDTHLSILKGIGERFETPFFDALCRYSQKPTGMFHALPISRGRTIEKSHWIKDMGEFYGPNVFLAETSATTGGLDSLLQPTGSLKKAQELAARAFGARQTFFVTNGTSTANKIVMQALVTPGDIVMLAHDCHKSHPYGVILSGAMPIYLDGYPLTELSMYGGVPIRTMKEALLRLKRAGKLDHVKVLLLTNVTFDGVTYDALRIMEEVLAIAPHVAFVWDEAWFAYGRFSPPLKRRTAMASAQHLEEMLASEGYRKRYAEWRAEHDNLDPDDDATWLDHRLLPDPDKASVRVYATQSTHKTLTALRQGSMIHVYDHGFERRVAKPFHDAYMTHTSTSPNYQILASLDVGRRQVELEGYGFVEQSLELAMTLRQRLKADPLLSKYFQVLGPKEMVPSEFRPSGIETYFEPKRGFSPIEEAWVTDEFVLDPTRVTLHVGQTGMDGDTFKQLLMERFDIHINKTSRNTVLFLIHIGMTRGTVAHLLKVLHNIASEIDTRLTRASKSEQQLHASSVRSLTVDLPPLPDFSAFHDAFRTDLESETREGDMRAAFFLAYNEDNC